MLLDTIVILGCLIFTLIISSTGEGKDNSEMHARNRYDTTDKLARSIDDFPYRVGHSASDSGNMLDVLAVPNTVG